MENQTNGKDVSADFLPLIPISSIDDTKNALRRTFRSVVRQALALDPCARAVKPFKTNGDVFGHKVLDDWEAVKALAKAAPENLRTVLESSGLSLYEKTQQMNAVMRSQWMMDKHGKFDGTINPKLLERQAKARAARDAAEGK